MVWNVFPLVNNLSTCKIMDSTLLGNGLLTTIASLQSFEMFFPTGKKRKRQLTLCWSKAEIVLLVKLINILHLSDINRSKSFIVNNMQCYCAAVVY